MQRDKCDDSIVKGPSIFSWWRRFRSTESSSIQTTHDSNDSKDEDKYHNHSQEPADQGTLSCSDAPSNTEELDAFYSAVTRLLGGTSLDRPKFRPSYSRIQHCSQLDVWDCGIACMIMILRWLRTNTQPMDEYPMDSSWTVSEIQEREWMIEQLGTQSIWTADLVLLLEKLVVQQQQQQHIDRHRYLFCSATFEVDPDHGLLGYYRDAFWNDQRRVTETFQTLQQLAAPMVQLSFLPTECVLDLVTQEQCLAMVLLDNSLLKSKGCRWNKRSTTTNEYQEHDTFSGHYVLLCGISFDPSDVAQAESLDGTSSKAHFCLALLNPSRSHTSIMFISVERFEHAWRAKGTDNDILFVVKDSVDDAT